jgi:hypothetical protein
MHVALERAGLTPAEINADDRPWGWQGVRSAP